MRTNLSDVNSRSLLSQNKLREFRDFFKTKSYPCEEKNISNFLKKNTLVYMTTKSMIIITLCFKLPDVLVEITINNIYIYILKIALKYKLKLIQLIIKKIIKHH